MIATLIENSLVHGGGRTLVKVRRNDHSTVVEVSDEGPGIDPELGKRVFERSVSGPRSSGTGVGLALARTLVEDDGGRLELLTEVPASFGMFLISAPGEETGPEETTRAEASDDLSLLPQGSVVRRRHRHGARRRGHGSSALASGVVFTDAEEPTEDDSRRTGARSGS